MKRDAREVATVMVHTVESRELTNSGTYAESREPLLADDTEA